MLKTFLIFLFGMTSICAQNSTSDTIAVQDTVPNLKFNYKQLIIPGILLGYGFIGLESDQLKSYNAEIKKEVNEDIDHKVSIDDFSQWAPAPSVYALNAFGVQGKNNLKDREGINFKDLMQQCPQDF